MEPSLGQLSQMMGQEIRGKDLYTYSFNFPIAELITAATVTRSINIENDSFFLWTKATYTAVINQTTATTLFTRVAPDASFQWRDTSSGRQLFNIPIPINNFWGTGEIPMILPEPKLLEPRSTITIDVTNLHDTEDYELNLSMIGIKLFT